MVSTATQSRACWGCKLYVNPCSGRLREQKPTRLNGTDDWRHSSTADREATSATFSNFFTDVRIHQIRQMSEQVVQKEGIPSFDFGEVWEGFQNYQDMVHPNIVCFFFNYASASCAWLMTMNHSSQVVQFTPTLCCIISTSSRWEERAGHWVTAKAESSRRLERVGVLHQIRIYQESGPKLKLLGSVVLNILFIFRSRDVKGVLFIIGAFIIEWHIIVAYLWISPFHSVLRVVILGSCLLWSSLSFPAFANIYDLNDANLHGGEAEERYIS